MHVGIYFFYLGTSRLLLVVQLPCRGGLVTADPQDMGPNPGRGSCIFDAG